MITQNFVLKKLKNFRFCDGQMDALITLKSTFLKLFQINLQYKSCTWLFTCGLMEVQR